MGTVLGCGQIIISVWEVVMLLYRHNNGHHYYYYGDYNSCTNADGYDFWV